MPLPNSISSNSVGLAFAEELSLKTLPGGPVWYGLEPNQFSDFGATLSTVTRTPINALRQQAKGTVSDLEAKAGFSSDLTQRNLTRLLQGFFFMDAIEKPATNPLNGTQVALTSVDITAGNHYNAGAGLNVFKVNALVLAKGFGVATNNGLKNVTASAAGILTVSNVLAVEAAPPAAASIETVGYQFPAGDLAATIVGSTIVLTSATINPSTQTGLTVGEWVFVGGDAVGTKYANNVPFYARVKSVNATQIILDLASITAIADTGAAKTIQIFYGKTIRNAITVAEIKRRSYQLERQLGNDGTAVQSEYVIGAVPDELTISMPQTAKVTADMTFVGMDVEYRTGAVGIKAGTRVAAPAESALNTSQDIFLSRIAVIDPNGHNPTALYAYLSDLKLSIKNGISGVKALGTLGSVEANSSDFQVSGTANAFFQSVAAAQSIHDNADVCLQAIVARANSGIVFDIPLLALGNGAQKVEKDKPIMVDLTTNAGQNPNGYTALVTVFEYLPTVAI
jgi:hypothetical protein